MKVGYVQTRPKIARVGENVEAAAQVIDGLDADLIVLPELFNTGYALTQSELGSLSEEIPGGYTVQRLLEISQAKGIAIVAGLAERSEGTFHNSAAFITPSSVEVHRKVHLFGKEKVIFKAGDRFSVHPYKGVRIGMMVCFDWFFPESCRTLMLKGAEIVAHPANLVLPFWPKASTTRAVENHLFIVTAGRVGTERGLRFIGSSLVASPSGVLLSLATRTRVEAAVVEVDPSEARDKHVTSFNDIVTDRRPSAYELG